MGTVNNEKVQLHVNSLVNETIYSISHARKSQNNHLLQFSTLQFLGKRLKLGQMMTFLALWYDKIHAESLLPVVNLMIKEYEKKSLSEIGRCSLFSVFESDRCNDKQAMNTVVNKFV